MRNVQTVTGRAGRLWSSLHAWSIAQNIADTALECHFASHAKIDCFEF